jgi:4-amino-4-deoxychorismate lyase
MGADFDPAELVGVRLIETMRRDADGTYPRLALHLERLRRSAARFGWPCDEGGVRAALDAIPSGAAQRVRLTLGAAGDVALSHADCPPAAPFWRIGIARERLGSADIWLRVKSTRRAIYDRARAALPEGIDELIFLNERGEVCDGTITNLFVRAGGRLVTPPLRAGLLPGVLRAELLGSGEAVEGLLRPDDLRGAGALFVGNALRGLIPAVAVF